MTKFEPVIGIEIHVQLATQSKMFCGCSADSLGAPPNAHCCPICLGHPGTLPAINRQAIEYTILAGLALNCSIAEVARFDRKNYFYPDLPKSYQISQFDRPLCYGGWVQVGKRRIRITKAHQEEDAAKLIHDVIDGESSSLIDFNRAGVPLLEIVSEPDVRTSQEAKLYLQKVQQILRYIGVSDCEMALGSMRCEANVSVRPHGSQDLPDYKVEIKNLNSFRWVQRAIEYEIRRQSEALHRGDHLFQETRGWDEKEHVTIPQRTKELAHGYRYFPEPDLPLLVNERSWVESLRQRLPELPDAKRARFVKTYDLADREAALLTRTWQTADYYEEACRLGSKENISAPKIANWVINRSSIEEVSPAELVRQIASERVGRINDADELSGIAEEVIDQEQGAVEQYLGGKTSVLNYMLGQGMRISRGKADPQGLRAILVSMLDAIEKQ